MDDLARIIVRTDGQSLRTTLHIPETAARYGLAQFKDSRMWRVGDDLCDFAMIRRIVDDLMECTSALHWQMLGAWAQPTLID